MKRIWWKVLAAIWVAVIVLNVAAWNSTAFCDWYIHHISPFWVNTYGRLTGLVPFSVGEIMIVLGLALVCTTVVLGLLRLCAAFYFRWKKQETGGGKWVKFRRRTNTYFKIFLYILTGTGLVMTLNCFILYHGSTFNEKYFGRSEKQYSLEELTSLRNYIVEQCNALSASMQRDEEGNVIYAGNMEQTAVDTMQKLGTAYGGLRGYYPYPKPLKSSDFLSQQYMAGYYFPFSMEANYNDVMYVLNKPATFCHELAHLKGYIYEDEANFIGYLACVQSEDIFFRYSGYLSVLYYVDNDFYDAVGQNRDKYMEQPVISSQVHADNIFLTDEEWERIEGKALFDTEVVDAVSDVFVETSLKLNGVSDGMISYSRVVRLLLQYHDIYGY